MAGTSGGRTRRWLVRVLVLAGMACLSWALLTWIEAFVFQRWARNELLASASLPSPRQPAPAGIAQPSRDDVIGILEIPRVGVSSVVVEGDDADALRIAVGHLPDTPLPWESGNSALAGHRDTIFRRLGELQAGDEIHLATAHGRHAYRVRDLMVVDPDAVWVLSPSAGADLTLITCYPFQYVGPAPRRFIVRATRRSAGRGRS
jgi:sortase A